MRRGDPEREELDVDGGEAGGPHPLRERGGSGPAADGVGEVLVGGAVPGDDSPEQRDEGPHVEAHEGGEGAGRLRGELEDDEASPRSQDPAELAEPAVEVLEVAHTERDRRDIDGGVAELDRSEQITGNYWLTRGLRGWGYMAAGRAQDAVSEVRAALELNRWGNWYSGLLAQYLFFAGDREAALIEARAAVKRFPEVEISHMLLSIVASGLGLHEEAVAAGQRAMELAPDTPLVHTALACALARGGWTAEATHLIKAIETQGIAAHCPWLATAYLALGRRDRAIDVLARAREVGSPQFVYAFVDPRLAELNGDPVFERLRPVVSPPTRTTRTD